MQLQGWTFGVPKIKDFIIKGFDCVHHFAYMIFTSFLSTTKCLKRKNEPFHNRIFILISMMILYKIFDQFGFPGSFADQCWVRCVFVAYLLSKSMLQMHVSKTGPWQARNNRRWSREALLLPVLIFLCSRTNPLLVRRRYKIRFPTQLLKKFQSIRNYHLYLVRVLTPSL